MMIAKALPLLTALALMAGCGGSSGGGSTSHVSVSGSFQGGSFGAEDAVSSPGTVTIVDYPNVCAAGLGHSAAKVLFLSFTSRAFPLGTTSLTGPDLDARIITEDATCNAFEEGAETGTVTISRVDASGVAGSFDLWFPGTDHLTGSFDAPSCNAANEGACP